MSKKPKKFREEKIAEEYFPVDKDDLKNTTEKEEKLPLKKEEILKGSIEKEYKTQERESIEKIESISETSRSTSPSDTLIRASSASFSMSFLVIIN